MKSNGEKKEWVEGGRSSRVHGIKGGLVLKGTEGKNCAEWKEVFLLPANKTSSVPLTGKIYRINKIIFGHKVILSLQGVENRNEAENIHPFILLIRQKRKHIDDILGFKAVDTDGHLLGTVVGLNHNRVQDIVEIRGEHSFDLPFVDQFVKTIDVGKNLIVVVKPEYIEDI